MKKNTKQLLLLFIFLMGIFEVLKDFLKNYLLIIVSLGMIVSILTLIVINIVRKRRLKYKYQNVDLDCFDGHQFEYFCAELLSYNDYSNVKVTKGSGDHGIDIFANKSGRKYAIQCKCYKSKVGNKAVQEAFSGANYYSGYIPIVMSNSYYTPQAIDEARKLNVILWNRSDVSQMIAIANKKIFQNNKRLNKEINMYNPQQGIYPSGQYLLGTDLPLGSYYLTIQKQGSKGEVFIYKTYNAFKNEEELSWETFEGDYHISLREKGLYVVFKNCDLRLVAQ